MLICLSANYHSFNVFESNAHVKWLSTTSPLISFIFNWEERVRFFGDSILFVFMSGFCVAWKM